MKIGILTAGGDCPGLNAVIRAVARSAIANGDEPVGVVSGFRGLARREYLPLDMKIISGILHLGGTMLSTSSYMPFREPDGIELVSQAIAEDGFDAVVSIGGEHTMMMTHRMVDEHGLPLIGVPKTIDNDVVGTDYTFGFHTAVQVATDAIDRLHSTAQSHDRIMVIEVMGRNTGWIAVYAGIAGGADGILIPEHELTVEELADSVRARHDRGKDFSIIVVAEGAELAFADGSKRQVLASTDTDDYGYPRLGGIGSALASELEERTGFETRVTQLGHVQRGGTPCAFDRFLATRYGIKAYEMARAGEFGRMAALRGTAMVAIPLAEVDGLKTVDLTYLDEARRFFG
ncbi:MAG: 6-phosphofructokinase [Solirubrobacterales bacterium]